MTRGMSKSLINAAKSSQGQPVPYALTMKFSFEVGHSLDSEGTEEVIMTRLDRQMPKHDS